MFLFPTKKSYMKQAIKASKTASDFKRIHQFISDLGYGDNHVAVAALNHVQYMIKRFEYFYEKASN